MSNYQRRDGDGVLFKNDRKEKETHPDYKGNVLIGGREYWLSAWIKEGKNGKFMSVSAQPKESQSQGPARRPQAAPSRSNANFDGFDEDSSPPF